MPKPRISPNGRVYNWINSLPDHRDLKYKKLQEYAAAPMPPSLVDLRPQDSPIFDQKSEGSCTGNGWAGIDGFFELAYLAAKLTGQELEFAVNSFVPFSRQFIYWNERKLDGDTDQDGGAQVRDGATVLANIGCCSEDKWPYVSINMYLEPNQDAYAEASLHKISSYFSIDNSDIIQLKTCLAQGFPFVFGFTVFQSFESTQVAQTGMMPMPDLGEGSLGGHCVMAIGYDDSKQVFILRNSWGTGWGDKGYFYMPYAYITNPGLASDFWTVRK